MIEGFLERFSNQGLPTKSLSPEALALLKAYAWPGNVRELANTIEGLLLLTQGETIRPEDLPQNIRPSLPSLDGAASSQAPPADSSGPPVPLTEVERVHVARVLRYTQGKKAPARPHSRH